MIKQKTKEKIHVRKGDLVKIISGSNKNKIGKITHVIYKTRKVIVENINIYTKHKQSSQQKDKGQIIKIEMPIHSSNVMLYSEKTKTASRYNYLIKENKQSSKKRIFKKTQEII